MEHGDHCNQLQPTELLGHIDALIGGTPASNRVSTREVYLATESRWVRPIARDAGPVAIADLLDGQELSKEAGAVASEVRHRPGVETIPKVRRPHGKAELDRLPIGRLVVKGLGTKGRAQWLGTAPEREHILAPIVGECATLSSAAAHDRIGEVELREVGHD
jgi:hypothetical protein